MDNLQRLIEDFGEEMDRITEFYKNKAQEEATIWLIKQLAFELFPTDFDPEKYELAFYEKETGEALIFEELKDLPEREEDEDNEKEAVSDSDQSANVIEDAIMWLLNACYAMKQKEDKKDED